MACNGYFSYVHCHDRSIEEHANSEASEHQLRLPFEVFLFAVLVQESQAKVDGL